MRITSPLPGSGFSSLAFSPASIPAVHYDPRAVALGLDGAGSFAIGVGGQIYRIRIPGVAGDCIASQRVDSHWCDSVILPAATWSGVANPDSGADWHIHPKTYSRGDRAGMDGFNAPILAAGLDMAGGVYQTLNLMQQAHIDTKNYAPDRFLCRTTIRRVGVKVLEVENLWINHSFTAMPGTAPGHTPLDFFNFPWAVLRQESLPVAYLELGNGARKNVSDLSWQDQNKEYLERAVNWFGLFESPTGVGLAIIPPQGARVKLGTLTRPAVMEDGRTSAPWTTKDERQFVFAPRHSVYMPFGQLVAARWYLLIGVRPNQAKEQAELRRPHAIIAQADAPPLPTYRVLFQGQLHDSLDPYLYDRSLSYLDGRYAIQGVF